MMPIDGDQVEAFRTNPAFSFTFESAEQTWKLSGAGPALERVRACIGAAGRKT